MKKYKIIQFELSYKFFLLKNFLLSFFLMIVIMIIIVSFSYVRAESNIYSNFVTADSTEYFKYNTTGGDGETDFQYIIPLEQKELLLNKIYPLSKYFETYYRKSFGFSLDERSTIVITSKNNQIANAFATVIPQHLNVYYSGGVSLLEEMSEVSWVKGLILHEGAHLYQLSAKQGLAQFTKSVFGNYFFFLYPIIPIPVFVYPNAILPTFLIEGNAILNESIHENGGRLYSGKTRAMLYALLKDDKIDVIKLINNHLEFPFTEEKYLIGAYFNLFLAQKFGVEKVNKFFLTQGKHYFIPLILNKTFDEHFGQSFYSLVDEFINKYTEAAKGQKKDESIDPTLNSATKSSIAKSLFSNPISADQYFIYFLTDETGKSYRKLNIIDKKTLQQKIIEVDLPAGKVFKYIDGKYYSATSNKLSNTEYVYGLWGEGRSFLPEFRSKYVVDINFNKDKVLYFDVLKSFEDYNLFLNEKFIGTTNSMALMNNKGDVYYFKQEDGSNRVLYKNQQKITSFKGHYSKMVDVESTGDERDSDNVYFVAATEFGESLFVYNGKMNKIFRVVSSDVVDNAKKINQQQILIAEITSSAYKYKIVKMPEQLKEELPTFYQFDIKKDWPKNESKNEPKKEVIVSTINSNLKEESYNSFTSLRMSTWDYRFSTANDGNDKYHKLSSKYNDPLQRNFLNISVEFKNSLSTNDFYINYLNARYPISWFATFENYHGYGRLADRYWNANSNYYDFEVGFSYPAYLWEHWRFIGALSAIYHSDAFYPLSSYQFLKISRLIMFPLSFSPYRYFGIELENINDYQKGRVNLFKKSHYQRTNISQEFIYDFGNEKILEQEFNYYYSDSWKLNYATKIKDSSNSLIDQGSSSSGSSVNLIPTITRSFLGFGKNTLHAFRYGVGGKLVLNYGDYYKKFPFSIRRSAIRLFANYIKFPSKNYSIIITPNNSRLRDYDAEIGGGYQSELLLAHIYPIKLSFDYVSSMRESNSAILINFLGEF
ncbi:MAG: hypothetical protein HQK51_08350 [Oligoflexia bacterium]|nr:hypothetical protein [Oligoflexia bacterium]